MPKKVTEAHGGNKCHRLYTHNASPTQTRVPLPDEIVQGRGIVLPPRHGVHPQVGLVRLHQGPAAALVPVQKRLQQGFSLGRHEFVRVDGSQHVILLHHVAERLPPGGRYARVAAQTQKDQGRVTGQDGAQRR